MKACYLIVFLFLSSFIRLGDCYGQGIDGSIAIKIDNPNKPLGDASIRVFKRSGDIGTCKTDINGTCTIAALPPGRYDVQFAVEGYPTIIYEGVLVQPGTKTELSYSFNQQTTIRDTIRIEYIPPRPQSVNVPIHSTPH